MSGNDITNTARIIFTQGMDQSKDVNIAYVNAISY